MVLVACSLLQPRLRMMSLFAKPFMKFLLPGLNPSGRGNFLLAFGTEQDCQRTAAS